MNFPPYFTRNNIPFYYDKSAAEFRDDPYERYDEMVLRQTALHLCDAYWGRYPFQKILDFIVTEIPQEKNATICELGCGVGRKIGELAKEATHQNFIGIDYSYQMLRRAYEVWKSNKAFHLDWSNKGFSNLELPNYELENLQLALAKASQLPFQNETIDLLYSSFLFDRVDDPKALIQEKYRVLKSGGKMILVSPLNFQKASHWANYHPVEKLVSLVEAIGFQNVKIKNDFTIKEPLDKNGNSIHWNCIVLTSIKK